MKQPVITFDETAKKYIMAIFGYHKNGIWLVDKNEKIVMKWKECAGISKEGLIKNDVFSLMELAAKLSEEN